MAETIGGASWDTIEELRGRIVTQLATETTLAGAAQSFVTHLAGRFPSIVLARMFVVTPFSVLPGTEQAFATDMARSNQLADPLAAGTPILTLLGSAGVESSWNRRETSVGHRAIPLDDALVRSAPMIASLLSALDVNLGAFRADPGVQLRAMGGGLNNTRFFVPDARTAKDSAGRSIIAAQDFVTRNGVVSVFGMGGGFLNRTLTVLIVFTREALEAMHIDRFASFIGTFKLATSKLVERNALFS